MKDNIDRRAFCCFSVAVNPFEEREALESWHCSAAIARVPSPAGGTGVTSFPADPGQSANRAAPWASPVELSDMNLNGY